MEVPHPGEGDVDIGTGIFQACWVLTAVVAIVLVFRFGVKAWVYWALPKVSSPERIWGLEDALFVTAYALEILMMCLVQKSADNGLGRHFYYLTDEERVTSMKFDFASQPVAVAASMISRTGMMWFLLQCFGINNKKTRRILVTCMIIQLTVNCFTILQIVLQCGPNPYRLVDRTAYFHYMWDPLPADGSVVCQDHSVQAIIGYVQGAFNTIVDFSLAYLSAFELWQFLFRTRVGASSAHAPHSLLARFRRLDSSTRSRRLWQTATLSGPLVLSGVASIVKTYLLKALGDRLDFTYNIPTFILWVKIENYSILIATCAPIVRLFLRIVVDARRGPQTDTAYGSASGGLGGGSGAHKKSAAHEDSVGVDAFDRLDSDVELGSVRGSEERIMGIQVKSDVTVVVREDPAAAAVAVRSREEGGRGGWSSVECAGGEKGIAL